MASVQFVTDLYLVTQRLPDVNVVETTTSGCDGNLWESSWRNKGKRNLAYLCNDSDEYVVTDIQMVPEDKDRGLDGYADLSTTRDTREKGLKKHTLYYKRDSRKTATRAVEQILLINQSKGELVPPLFTAVAHSANEILIIFKLTDLPKVSQPPKLTMPTQSELMAGAGAVPSSPLPVVGIDGIPFQLNSKYDGNRSNNDPVVNGISVIVIDDLLNKYQYNFETEEKVVTQEI